MINLLIDITYAPCFIHFILLISPALKAQNWQLIWSDELTETL